MVHISDRLEIPPKTVGQTVHSALIYSLNSSVDRRDNVINRPMSGRTSFTLSSTVDGTARGDREGRKIFITFRNPVNMQMENANRILFAPTTKAIVPFALRPSKDFCFSNTPPSSPASYPHSFADNSRFTPRSHVSKK